MQRRRGRHAESKKKREEISIEEDAEATVDVVVDEQRKKMKKKLKRILYEVYDEEKELESINQ